MKVPQHILPKPFKIHMTYYLLGITSSPGHHRAGRPGAVLHCKLWYHGAELTYIPLHCPDNIGMAGAGILPP
jgi:hypothetical protein